MESLEGNRVVQVCVHDKEDGRGLEFHRRQDEVAIESKLQNHGTVSHFGWIQSDLCRLGLAPFQLDLGSFIGDAKNGKLLKQKFFEIAPCLMSYLSMTLRKSGRCLFATLTPIEGNVISLPWTMSLLCFRA